MLERGATQKVLRRTLLALEAAKRNRVPLNIGLDHVILGRIYPSNSIASQFHLDEAVRVLRDSGAVCYLPLALLARGKDEDLVEANAIATRSTMRIYMADYHLASARRWASGDHTKALDHLVKAEALVNDTGYHRRDAELVDLRRALQR